MAADTIDPIEPGAPSNLGPSNVLGSLSGLVNIDTTMSVSGQIAALFNDLNTSLVAIKLKLPTV